MQSFFKLHWPAFILAITIGAIIAAPPLVWHFSKDYQGVDMMKTNTETIYMAFVQEVYDGHPWLGNPYLADLKNQLYLFPPLSANIIAAFGRLLGVTAIQAVMIWRFFNAAALALLIYFFGYQMTHRRLVGLVAAPFVLLGYSLVNPAHLLDLLSPGGWSQEKSFIDYGRPLTPQVSVLFFYAYLVVFWKYLEERSTWIYGVLAAIILGLSFYVYLFTWSFLFALTGLLLIVLAVNKDWRSVRKIIALLVGALLIGLPYLWHLVAVVAHPWYQESATRFGFVATRVPYLSRLLLGTALIWLASYRLLSSRLRRFWAAFLITALVVVNEQVVTGRFIFNHHYHWYYITPLTIIFFVVVLFRVLEKYSLPRLVAPAIAMVLVVFFFYNGIMTQAVSYIAAVPVVRQEQRYAPLLAWLNETTPKDSVVLADSVTTGLIPALTHNNVYDATVALYTLIPDERLLHSYLVFTYLHNVATSTIRSYFEAHREEISNTAFGYRYYFQPGVCIGCFPDSVITSMVEEYQPLTDENFIAFVKRYPIDYFVWDKQEHPEWVVDKRWHWQPVYAVDDIFVYAIR